MFGTHAKNCKMLMEEVKEAVEKWGETLCPWFRTLNTGNVSSPQIDTQV